MACNLLQPGSGEACHATAPTFGLPCPTAIFTAGVLLPATFQWRSLVIVPIVWSVIGGSAAILLGVSADYALPVAGAALALRTLQASPRTPAELLRRSRMAG